MTEDVCPVRNCDPDDCALCDGLPPFEECVYVQVYRSIQSGEFQRDKGIPWEPLAKEVQSSNNTPKCKSVDECEFKTLDKRCELIGECGDKVIGDVPNKRGH